MSDILVKGMDMPKQCWNNIERCPFHFLDYHGKSHCGQSDEIRCLRTKRPKDCPLVEYPTDFMKRLVQDLERLSDRVHELSQDYMSDDLYDVHVDMAECIESIMIVFGKEASE